MISGTFVQNGKEFDGAAFARRDVRAIVSLRCECGKPLVTAGSPDLMTCVNRECRFREIIYRVQWPTVCLEAVQDSPPLTVEEKVSRVSEGVALDTIEPAAARGEWTPRERGRLGRVRELPE